MPFLRTISIAHHSSIWFSILGTLILLWTTTDRAIADGPVFRTTLSNSDIAYTVPDAGYVVLKRGDIEAIIVDNRAVNDSVLSEHKSGYHGVAALKHTQQPRNIFVPNYSGLNFEHIHDGTTVPRDVLYEPRHAPMQLRSINAYTAELYQSATPYWGLESCSRYELLESGTIELTFECIPRKDTFKNNYIGLFWASYIHEPESLDIHYQGTPSSPPDMITPGWIRGVTPKHGVSSTHLGIADLRSFSHSSDFPLTLVFNEAPSRFTSPWYFGLCRDMALAQFFRSTDQIRFSQSPSGGGQNCPAWDFQWFIPDYKVNHPYQTVMRMAYFSTGGLSEPAIKEKALNVARGTAWGFDPSPIENKEPPMASRTLARLKREEPTRIVCLGDSVTGVYYHTGGHRAYTDMLGIALKRTFPKANLSMVNAGISGHTTINGLERLSRDVLQHQPTLVTVMFGLNDMVRVPLDQYRANLVTIVRRCWETGAEVVLCTPNNVINDSGRPTATLRKYCEAIHSVGREMNVPVADCFARMEALEQQDPASWRMLLSDAIHPNMDGHKRMAEFISETITGLPISIADQPVTPFDLSRLTKIAASGRAVKVLAMTPFDNLSKDTLQEVLPTAKLEIVPWDITNKSLPDIQADAQGRVRNFQPDLVIIAVPRSAGYRSREELVNSFSWVMNWSLSFDLSRWECMVIHPDVVDPKHPDKEYDALIRRLVRAQDLKIVDRVPGDGSTAAEIFRNALK